MFSFFRIADLGFFSCSMCIRVPTRNKFCGARAIVLSQLRSLFAKTVCVDFNL